MLVSSTLILIGLIGLVLSGDRFVTGASALARNLGVSPLLVGLTIVAFGTSAPEIFVSIIASLRGNPGIAVGNAIGSNIANVGLVLGVTALFIPIEVHSRLLKREYPILFFIMIVVAAILWDGQLQRLEGTLLLIGMAVLVAYMVWWGLKQRNGDPMTAEFTAEIPADMATWLASLWVIFGLIVLPVSSEIFVQGAVGVAKYLGVSDLVIGLTVVALGTSLPELFASLMGVIKNEHDIALGNILGSNMFNLLAVMGIPGLLSPTTLSPAVMHRDFPTMFILTLLLFFMSYGHRKPGRIGRLSGTVLLLIYVGYVSLLVYQLGF
ncbi:MAG: calcium/sodium antiporter [Legionellales bacterium]|nr:calcium/sodium antiporter [Legionellales bacterium]|tara:strand:- start:30558 stop:31526 length:969 start_codon:yes stop_codon:yes gene_type:complete